MKLQELLQNPKYKQKFVLEKLIQEYLGFDRATMRVHLDQEIPSEQLEIIQTAYQSYIEEKKPLEYILGHVDFFGVPFYVNEHTLIPRPETEYMITAVTEYITSLHKEKNETKDAQNNILLDIGTGCGVLGISVLLQNPNRFREIFFSDISEEALKVAQQNYKKLITNSYNT
ncbi:MAG: methyltransferase, partial [Candidatus Peribacteria bacterium]|nr:methyltransferase [Candidatus Peribacteria bacterium]